MIVLNELSKRFGIIRAVDRVSFTVNRGEVLGFLGPNGAGKSTTMKMLAGFLTPSGGSASICGHDVVAQPIQAKQRLGYLPEGAPAYPDMTARGFLMFIAGVRGLSGREATQRIGWAVERTQLTRVLDQPIDTLSKGFKRRVGLAQAILHDPDVLILDEPTDGLDPNQKHEVRGLIRDIAGDKAIIISTHILEEVEAVCSRAIVIARGRVLADDTPDALVAQDPDHGAVCLTVDAAVAETAIQALATLPGVIAARIEPRGPRALVLVRSEPGVPIVDAVREFATGQPWDSADHGTVRGRLDQVFRTITTDAA
ncbi:MAG: ATP-binding cassette domain-containing protein [Alphaproteobacteria bacterium]|nr:ATP-binding cassette domain-containing protein [Alphaproteobacteria bacterium]TAD87844.1 MAG: ATP-binding cassette domain-containing protein [Alphaproteobacteria bacterium]